MLRHLPLTHTTHTHAATRRGDEAVEAAKHRAARSTQHFITCTIVKQRTRGYGTEPSSNQDNLDQFSMYVVTRIVQQ